MKKIIKQVVGDIVQVTIADERWYVKTATDKKTGLPSYEYVPSVTWIAGSYPKGIAFYKWLADKGWNEAEALKSAAGDKGSKIHAAIVDLLDGKEVAMDAKYTNPSTEQAEELTIDEYEAIKSFAEWFRAVKPTVIAREIVVFSKEYGYAGTIDLVCEIGGEKYIIDFKTGQYVWPEYELQVSAYKHAFGEDVKLGILQVGYNRNKNKWKYTDIEDKFELFLAARKIWENEHAGEEPARKDLPLSISLVEKQNDEK